MISGLMDSFATAVSIMLQYQVPLEVLCKKFSNSRFEPSGFTTNPEVPTAKSIMDYIFRWMEIKFLNARPEDQPQDFGAGVFEFEKLAGGGSSEPASPKSAGAAAVQTNGNGSGVQ